jgi:CRISPR-associated endoribonuclease Cas6
LLHANLEKKHLLVKGISSNSPVFSITPLAVRDRDCKMLKFKGTWVRGWMGKYLLEGDPGLLKVAYDAGLGSKNSQGFGLFEVEEAM